MSTRLDYDHEAFKRRLETDPASGGLPPDFGNYPPEARRKWWAANTEALLADSDPLVGCDSLDEDDFLAEIGKEWNDPEFLAGAKSFKANGNDRQRRFPRISTLTYSTPRSSPERKSRKIMARR